MHSPRPLKNHMAKSTFTENFTPTQHKGRRVPLHLLERVEQEFKKLNRGQTNNQTREMLRRIFLKSSSNNS